MTAVRSTAIRTVARAIREMTLAQLWAFLAVALPVLAAFLANLSAVDLAYHVRAGGELLDTGRISTTDMWTFTVSGAAWLNQQWLAQGVLAAVFRVAGWTGLAALRALLVGVTFGFIFEACRRRGLDLRRAAWLTIAAFIVGAVALALRPQLFGMVLAAVSLLLVADRRAHPHRLWIMPVIVAVWANMHGSFFLGPVFLGLAWLEDLHDRRADARATLAIAVLAGLAALVNPFTVDVWRYAVGLSTNSFVTSRITEWQPTTLRSVPGMLFYGSAALVVVLLARRERHTSWPTLVWLGVFAVIGGYAIRGVAWWPLGAAVAVAPLLAPSPRDVGRSGADAGQDEAGTVRGDTSSPLNAIVAAVVVVACVALLPSWRPIDPATQAPAAELGDAPPGITAALRDLAKPGDRVLNPQPWGSWFELALPGNPVAIDSRIELFPRDVWTKLDAVRGGEAGWQDQLAQWNVRFVVTTDEEAAFVARLTAAGWHVVFHDSIGSVLETG